MKLWRLVLLVVLVYVSVKTTIAADGFEPQNFTIKDESGLKNAGDKEARDFGLTNDLSEDNPLYREILGHFKSRYNKIGQDQIDAINAGRNLSVVGGMNHIGISYQKPFASFSVNFQRQVAPDLFDDVRWIVTDTMDLYIDAQKLLSNLKDHDVIDISEKQYALFAGVTFKRSYRYVHFANSYEEGLAFNLDHLFLGFTNFRSKNFLDLAPYEFMTKEDSLSFAAGGVGSIPLGYGFNASAGILVTFEKLSKVEIQSLGPDDNPKEGEILRISYEKEKSKKVGASAALMYDFLGLLRMTLLKYDFSYEKKSSKKYNFSFFEEDIEELRSQGQVAQNVHKMLRLKDPNVNLMRPYLVSQEDRETEIKNSKYSALIFGGYKNMKTQMVNIQKDDVLKTFFRHNFEKTKYVENLWSRLFKIVIKSFLRMDTVVNKSFRDTKIFRLEYDSKDNLLKTKGDIRLVKEEEKLTINFNRDYYAYNVTKGVGKKHRKRMVDVANRFSGLDPYVVDMLEAGHITGPVNLDINYVVGKDGLNHFNSLNLNQVYDLIEGTCKNQSKGIFKFFRSLFSNCKKDLQRKYDKYIEERDSDDYSYNQYQACLSKAKSKKRFSRRGRFSRLRTKRLTKACLKKFNQRPMSVASNTIPLWRYKDFLQLAFEKTPHKNSLFHYFGHKNIYQHGRIAGLDQNQGDFVSYFSEGVFKGTGLVDNYLRATQIRSPASISVD